MANATDARISVGFPGHPKTKKLARRLGDAGPLHCIYLFLWTAANRSDGDLSGMTDEDIELAINWNGEPEAFVQAMALVGFMDGEEGRRQMHDWADHNAWAAGAIERSRRAKFAVACREFGRVRALEMYPEFDNRPPEDGKKKPKDDPSDKASTGSDEPAGQSGSSSATKDQSNGSDVDDLNGSGGSSPYPTSPIPSDTLPSPSKNESTDVDLSAAAGDAGADDGDLLGKIPKQRGKSVCPHMEIIALYHEILPELRAVRTWEDDRQRMLRSRWNSSPDRQSLDWWRTYFTQIREMPWLMGKRTGRDGNTFQCTLEWLVRPKNFAKVIEGNYLELNR